MTTEKNKQNIRFGKISLSEERVHVGNHCYLDAFLREKNGDEECYWIEDTITPPVIECSNDGEIKTFKTCKATYIVVDEHEDNCKEVHWGLVDTIPEAGKEVKIIEIFSDYDEDEIMEKEITAIRVGDTYAKSGAFVIYDENDIYLLYQRGKI